MARANDTFVEGSDTALASHTPTGTDAGAGWSQIGGAATVLAATDLVVDDNAANGNRARMTTDLGSAQMDVQADVSSVGGSFTFPGVMGRVNSAGTERWEFTYDFSGGRWQLADTPNTTTVTFTEAWPGGTNTMKIACRPSNQRGYVNGLEKCASTANTYAGQFGGIVPGNFNGTTRRHTIDNYVSSTWTPPILGNALDDIERYAAIPVAYN